MPKQTKDLIFVGIQLFLFLIYLFELDFLSFNAHVFIKYMGLFGAVTGAVIAILAVIQLSTNLSIFPTPREGSSLVSQGVFKYSRHPIYAGIIIGALGIAFYLGSGYKLVVSITLWILFYFKSKHEEMMLVEKFPEYKSYKRDSGRFFPKLF